MFRTKEVRQETAPQCLIAIKKTTYSSYGLDVMVAIDCNRHYLYELSRIYAKKMKQMEIEVNVKIMIDKKGLDAEHTCRDARVILGKEIETSILPNGPPNDRLDGWRPGREHSKLLYKCLKKILHSYRFHIKKINSMLEQTKDDIVKHNGNCLEMLCTVIICALKNN